MDLGLSYTSEAKQALFKINIDHLLKNSLCTQNFFEGGTDEDTFSIGHSSLT